MAGPWAPVRAIHRRAKYFQNPAETISPDTTWEVPFVVKGVGDGARPLYSYWFGFQFSRALPSLDQWPTESNWPPN